MNSAENIPANEDNPTGMLRCEGCRSTRRSGECSACDFIECAQERGVAFCAECSDYPCGAIEAFRLERPDHLEIRNDLERIITVGAERWIEEVQERYLCPACKEKNSAFDLVCRYCGNDPASDFAKRHKKRIDACLKRHPIRS